MLKFGKWVGWLLNIASALLLASCGGFLGGNLPLDPERPKIVSSPTPQADASELFVILELGVGYGYDLTVYVDGEARAWITESGSYTRLPVTPGKHSVKVSHRMERRELFFVLILPVAKFNNVRDEVEAETTIDCLPQSSCAVIAKTPPADALGHDFKIDIVPPEKLPEMIEGLQFVEGGPVSNR
jgi:hypothetical protein